MNDGWNEEDTHLITYYDHYYFDSMKTLIDEIMDGLGSDHQDPEDPLPINPTALEIHDLINKIFTPRPLLDFLFSNRASDSCGY